MDSAKPLRPNKAREELPGCMGQVHSDDGAGERRFPEKVATELSPNQKHEKSECEMVEEVTPTKGVLSLEKKKCGSWGMTAFVA